MSRIALPALALVGAALGLADQAHAQQMELVQVASGLSSPLYVLSAPGDSDRLFILEQNNARVLVQQADGSRSTFLDVNALASSGGERGLLGMAFDPQYNTNGHFYINYTDNAGDTVIARYTVSGDPDVADAGTALTILTVDQPFSNHNGGMLAFDPSGMLMIGMGDGGSAGDPIEAGQDPQNLLGKILRIDVSSSAPGNPYDIPADNPFVGDPTTLDEIWALGVRNPWRFSFDRDTGDLYIGDVGQNQWEEVSFEAGGSAGGLNFGWDVMEGEVCFEPSVGCNMAGLTQPIHVYNHAGGRCSITGGYVYRGGQMPWFEGRYIFADYCSHDVYALRYTGGAANVIDLTSQLDPFTNITSFGEDADGNLYMVGGGRVWWITSALRLDVTPLTAGSLATFTIEGADPGQKVYVAYSVRGLGTTDLAPLNVTLNLDSPKALRSANADASGTASIDVTIPAAAAGRDVWFQAVVDGNASNVWTTTVQ